MGLLDRLRGWLGASGDETATVDDADDETDADDEAGVDDGPRLDPEGATEVRSREKDDPVERLRDVETARRGESESESEPEPAPDGETDDHGA